MDDIIDSMSGWGLLKEVLGYVLSYEDNLNGLKEKAEELNALRESVIHEVKSARKQGEVIKFEVERWLNRVDGVLRDADKLYNDTRNDSAVCSPCSFPNFRLRSELSEQAEKLIPYLLELSAAVKGRLDHVTERHSDEFESRKMMKEHIVWALSDPDVTRIGIYGISGIGKTVLARQVAQLAKGEMFDAVYIITVSQSLDVERIQREIADLHERIKKEESVLIILDDVWEENVVESLGIPLEDDIYNGCKLLLTSRNLDVLQKNDTQKDFLLYVLSGEESRSLFRSRAGDVDMDANLQDLAIELAQRCAGLPLAIATMAASLRGRGISYWKEALRILDENNHIGMKETIYSIVEFSYNQLKHNEMKQVFLLCGLHGPSISVSDLLKYVIGLGVFKHVISIDDARSKLHRIIADLEKSSLLLRNSAREVNMHDLIHEVASSIAARDGHVFMMERTAPLEYWPREDFLRRCSQIILEGNYIQKLPGTLYCPNLYFLYLNTNDNPTLKIPDFFFEGMTNLRVLVFIGVIMSSLPASLVLLDQIKTLCFNQCCLKDLVRIKALQSLEILSFFQSYLQEFPSEIGELINLRMLDLSSSKIEVIPPNIISNLDKLEELYMGRSIKWDVESLAMQKENDILAELTNLTSLTALELQIRKAWFLPWSIIFEKLKTYNIVIGDQWGWSDSNGTSRSLKLNPDPNIHLEQEVKAIVKGVEELYLEEINGFSNVLYELNGEGFPLLKKLHIQNNTKIQHIVYSSERNQTPALFPNLERMILDNLNNLKEICRGPLNADLFEKLKVIKVKSCGELEYLFLASMIKKFSQLVEIEVSECSSMKNIVLLDSGTTIDEIEYFPVRSLTLQHLGAITGFCSNGNVGSLDIPTLFPNTKAVLPGLKHLKLIRISTIERLVSGILTNRVVPLRNLESMEIVDCHNLDYLFVLEGLYSDVVIFGGLLPNLRRLCLRDLPSFTSILGPNNYQKILKFKMLNHLTVCRCHKLKYLLPLYVLEDLQQLKTIDISECASLEQVFVDEQATQTTEPDGMEILPLFHSLKLTNLPKLTSMCSGAGYVISRSLSQMRIENCPKFSFTSAYDFRRIEVQGPSKKKSKEATLPGFKHLKLIHISTTERLVSWIPTNRAVPLENLETMEIVECNYLHYLFDTEDHYNDAVRFGGLLPELRRLCLRDLSSFRSIVGHNNVHQKMLKFKMLNNLTVCGCDKLKYLLPLYVLEDLEHLKSIDISDCASLEQVFVNEQATQTTKPDVMEALPLLHSLKLTNLPKLASMSSGTGHVVSCFLTQLTIQNCPKFSFTFAYTLRRIEEQGPSKKEFKEMIIIPSELKTLNLQEVDDLKNMREYPLFSLAYLASLQLWNCNNLEYLFSLSMAQKLSSLQELKIISCRTIEQIVKRETEEKANVVEFPQVKTLILDNLPKFTGMSSQDGSSVKWLALGTIQVTECPNIKKSMLGTVDRPLLKNVNVANCPPREYEDRESKIGYLFNLTDELSKLEILKIEDSKQLDNYMEMELQESSFRQLRAVEALKCDNELNKFLSILLHRSYKLNQLTIKNCELLEQVFDLTEFVDEEQGNLKFPHLQTMQLLCLPKLKCIWNKDPRGIVELGKLVKLEIIKCGLCTSPFSTSLLEKLVLVEELKIESCEMIEHVVEDDTEMHERSFPNLKKLQLASLPKLIKFNSGRCDFRFPRLKILKIEKCPELNAFTTGFLSNQPLTNEGTSDNVPSNETMHACPKLNELTLTDLKAVEVDSLRRLENLKILVVRNCSFLGRLVLPSNCSNLREIEVSSCIILEKISTDPVQEKLGEKTFHNLKSIILENLKKLSIFSLETCEFPSLEKLRIVNCPTLVTLPRNVSTEEYNSLNKHSASLVSFEDIKEDSLAVEGQMKISPHLKSLELADLPNMQLWKQEPQIPVFQNLILLKIMRCRGIEKLFSISVAEHLSVLKFLKLYECTNMVQVLGGGGGNSKQLFRNLETLVLKHLPSLTSFCEDEDVDFEEFPELNMVRVEDVPNMHTFVKKPLIISTPKLKQVRVTFITKCWLGDLNKTITYLHENRGKLKDEVWECDQSSTRHHSDIAESSSQNVPNDVTWGEEFRIGLLT